MRTRTKVVVVLCTLTLAVSCGKGELSRAKAKELIEQSPAFREVLSVRPDVTRKVQRITGVRNEGKQAFAELELRWDGDLPVAVLTANRTATARFSLYDDGWRYDGLVAEESSTKREDALWVIQQSAEKGVTR